MRRLGVFLVLTAWCGAACSSSSEHDTPKQQPAAANELGSALRAGPVAEATPTQPAPRFEFVAPKPWQSSRKGSAPLPPPDMSLETWRVLVTQNAPLQKQTPLWQDLPAARTVELEMPQGSRWRCSSSPLVVTTQADDFSIKLNAWELTRTFRCSSDAWRTWSEYHHVTRVLPDGRHEMGPDGGALLRERSSDGRVVETFVLLRSDKEVRAATTGPPKIMPGVHVDDD